MAVCLGVAALAPVLDLDVESRNPIVGTRSFGPDPASVAALGGAWIASCQAEGIAACAKHFPGHGRTAVDSHAELPVVDASRDTLEADLSPWSGRSVTLRLAAERTRKGRPKERFALWGSPRIAAPPGEE